MTEKLADIANRIHAHLKRIEASPVLNPWLDGKVGGLTAFYEAQAHRGGSRIGIRYISYQATTYLSRQDALRYLAWLDAGNVGKHWKALR